ncbi:hypothetical protein SAMN05444166_1300 [Singulisphaera sp. GP187]|uniref:hypothetical protein n=1 Tax=Singulisphaera sp. GP187 TaxID=1882752 RepID=UPI00092A0159|nr:hypothetical protein [Singulisphaera sp. GP187]SIN85829.1 hypothetical protein SAMN05444166_1300 [Singulisphaera sp. GP187]
MTSLVVTVALIGLVASSDDPAEIGRSIQAVDRLLEYRLPAKATDADHAQAKELRKAAVDAGQLTRLYPWVLGRLKLEVELVESALRDTRPEQAKANELRERITFLKKLIHEIDAPH